MQNRDIFTLVISADFATICKVVIDRRLESINRFELIVSHTALTKTTLTRGMLSCTAHSCTHLVRTGRRRIAIAR